MDATTVITLGIEFLLTIIIALIGFIIKDMKTKISILESDVKGMKDNYLTRFERVIANQNEAKEALVSEHNKTKLEIIEKLNEIQLDISSIKNKPQTKKR